MQCHTAQLIMNWYQCSALPNVKPVLIPGPNEPPTFLLALSQQLLDQNFYSSPQFCPRSANPFLDISQAGFGIQLFRAISTGILQKVAYTEGEESYMV